MTVRLTEFYNSSEFFLFSFLNESFLNAHTYTHACHSVKVCADSNVSPPAQDDPTGASQVTNAEGPQQAV